MSGGVCVCVGAESPAKTPNRLLATGRALRRRFVTAMGISARMGAEQ